MNKLYIAMVAHENNRAYCLSVGDTSILPWAQASEDQRNRIIAGVEIHLKNPDTTPQESHESWLTHMTAKGWKFGPIKDEAKKEHPAMVPYGELSQLQRTKDYLFNGIVAALAALPTEQAHAAAEGASSTLTASKRAAEELGTATIPAMPSGFTGPVAIEYVGKRPFYKENLYGTGILFAGPGDVKIVAGPKAALMLKHPDVYRQVDIKALAAASTEQPAAPDVKHRSQLTEEQENDLDEAKRSLTTMNRKNMATWAKVNLNLEVDPKLEPAVMRNTINVHIDQFGLATV